MIEAIPPENIIEWSRNGIEYVYPDDVVALIFGDGPELKIDGDLVSRNGITLSKGRLAEQICGLIRPETKMNFELCDKLLDKLDMILK
jgi:hypothetical protein